MNIVHGGVGPISESDVDLAQACGAFIVGFNIRNPPSSINQAATQAGVKVIILVYTKCSHHVSFECCKHGNILNAPVTCWNLI